MPQNQIASIAQSPDGAVWAASLDGLVAVFDGRQWTQPGPFFSERLSPGYFVPAGDRVLLAGANGGLIEIQDRTHIRTLTAPVAGGTVRAAARTGDGRLWLLRSGELVYRQGAGFHPVPLPAALGRPIALLAARDGVLWIGARYGIAKVRNGVVEIAEQPWRTSITSLAEGLDGAIYAVVERSRVIEIRGGSVTAVEPVERLRMSRSLRIAGLHMDRHGSLWLHLSGDGIARVAGGRIDVFTEKDGVPATRPSSDAPGYWIWEDREGTLWFGLNFDGIATVRDSPVVTHGAPEGLTGGVVSAVLEDSRGTVWANAQSGPFRLMKGTWSALDLKLSDPGRGRCLMEAADGSLWICFDNAIVRVRDGRVAHEIRVAARPRAMATDEDGQVWIGGGQTGILDWKAAKPSVAPVAGVCSVSRGLFKARDGALWVLCESGSAIRYRAGKTEEFNLGRDSLQSIYQDRQGAIWIGKASSGLHRLAGGKVTTYRTRESEDPDDVLAIVEDQRSHLWLTSSSGLRRVSRPQLEEVAEGKRDKAWFQHFDESAGLRTRDFSAGTGGFLARDGSILLPSAAGVVQVNPAFDFSWQPSFEPVLDSVQVRGAPVTPGARNEVSLRASESRVAFHFSVPMVWSPHLLHYQLAGFEPAWQAARDGQPASYTNLPPGRYHFLVRISPFGGEPGQPKRLATINVDAPFYRTGWFLALTAVLLALIGAQIAHFRARRVRQQNERLEAEVLQRTDQLQMALRSERMSAAAALAREQDLEQVRVRLEGEIRQRADVEQQLIHAQKMESVDRLAGGVAHDFNNLLTVIFANLELAKLSETLDAEQAAHLDEIEQATRRAADLTRQLLTFARRQIVEPKVVDVNTIITGLGRILRRLVGEDVELVMIMAADLGPVKVDPGQFEQILLNLVINARDAMPRGGKLTIETHANEDSASVSVTDTGMGMDQATMDRIFEPFFTTKRDAGGTGLGLAICYGITRQAGGDIRVKSEPGKGARFEVVFPLVEGKVEQLPQEVFGPWAVGDERILVAEDEDRVRELIVHTLRAHGYQVTAAANGEEALRALEAGGWNSDLVIADVVMPLMGGRELADRLAERRPGARILYISGYTEDASFHSHLAETGRDFLAKPFALAGLARKVRQVLDRGTMDREMAAGA